MPSLNTIKVSQSLQNGRFLTCTAGVKANSHMGIIPEIERVWISIEHKLLLWDYTEGCVLRSAPAYSESYNYPSQEISSFEDQPYVINHVAIVKPKKALFIEEISYLLVICTPVAVTLIGVAQTPVPGTRRKTLTLYATDLTVNTEVEMASVIGTPDGRIFMSGSHDGNLYELHYQSTESWFGKRVQLINHSVGGMSSLIPRFASSNVDGALLNFCLELDNNPFFQIALSSSSPIIVGIVSIP